MGPSPPEISSISVERQAGTMTIDASGYESIEWISNGDVIHEESELDLNEVTQLGNNVSVFIGYQHWMAEKSASNTK